MSLLHFNSGGIVEIWAVNAASEYLKSIGGPPVLAYNLLESS
jgi:hypothetical protein